MYEEPILADNVMAESVAVENTSVDASDNASQEPVKSKAEEDAQQQLHSSRIILSWGLVFTFFR